MVKVEWVVARYGAVETGFEVGGPPESHSLTFFLINNIILITLPIAKLVLASLVILANPGNPRIDALKQNGCCHSSSSLIRH